MTVTVKVKPDANLWKQKEDDMKEKRFKAEKEESHYKSQFFVGFYS